MNQQPLIGETEVLFRIAGHSMKVIMPDKYNWKQLLPSFRPFEYHSDSEKEPMCSIRMVEQPITIEPDSAQLLSEVSDVLGHWFCLMETDQNYIFDIQFLEHGNCYRMVSDKLFSTATAYVDGSDRVAGLVLSSFLMIAFAQSAVLHQTILIHSSVIEKDRQGYAFLGKSGTGKSTHSALWLKYIEGTELLNDDNPAIRIEENGEVYIYGTPWSGKTPCYKNRSALLKAFVRLEQAPENHFQWKDGVSALITILPSCSSMRWNSLLYTGMCNILEKVIGKVKIGYLKCLPDKEAAYLCYKETEKE